MSARLADRLKAARRQQFIGRDEERQLFEQALREPEPPFGLLHIHGPGGMGKTTLLRAFAAMCAPVGARALLLDGHNIDPAPPAFIAALNAALGLAETASPGQVLDAAEDRYVLLIDTYELLEGLDGWLRDVFLPSLPASTLVATAGRNPKSAAWHTDPGWQVLLREVPLRAFNATEGSHYLARHQVDATQHEAILAFTHGHPLALSLVADLFQQRPGLAFEPEAAPDVIKVLVDQFVQHVPGPAQRAALEASALVRVVNEALLGALLTMPDARAIFEWMRGVSFIEAGPFGLYPHELAREALTADLRWRNPDWFAELHNRARAYYAERIEQTHGRDQQRLLFDYIFLHRDNPIIKPFLDWQETGSALPVAPTEDNRPALRAMVERHEGPEAARLADHWLRRQPEGAMVFLDLEGTPAGYLHLVALQEAMAEDRALDPTVEAACAYLEGHAPLRPGERGTLIRFWMAADSYQDVSAMQSLLFLKMAQHYLTTPDLAFSFFPCADADFWEPFCGYTELVRTEEAAFEMGGRTYGVFTHDWRAVPPMLWLDHMAARELDTTEQEAPPVASEALLAILDEAQFREAVYDALRVYARPYQLQDNPLLRSRLVIEAVENGDEEADRIEALRGLLAEASSVLQNHSSDSRLYRVLDRTYFRPAGSQEQVAELLDLPYSTFRRHLKRGRERVAELLWQQEIGRR